MNLEKYRYAIHRFPIFKFQLPMKEHVELSIEQLFIFKFQLSIFN